MSFDPRRVTTASELRALSHPLRIDIIEQLGVRGPLTASELGEALGESPANCSWHLRKLAEHAFVEETHDGHGRRRPWRLVKLGLTWGSEPDNDEDGDDEPAASVAFSTAARALEDALLDREVARYRRNGSGTGHWGGLGMSENVLLLTEREARALQADLQQVYMRHRGRLTGDEPRPDDARTVHMLLLTSVDPATED